VTAAGSYLHEQTRKRAGGEVSEVARAIRAPRVRQAAELDLFRLYLNEIGRRPLLTKQDEARLSRADQAGLQDQRKLADTAPDDPARADLEAVAERGEWARRTMVEANLRLVVSIARRFSATGLPIGGLVQEGNMGLLRAVEKFDWRKGFKFSTYATWWIRQAMARGAADRGARAIRLPVHVEEQVGRLWRTQARLHEQLGQELAGELDMAPEKVARARRSRPRTAAHAAGLGSGAGRHELLLVPGDRAPAAGQELVHGSRLADPLRRRYRDRVAPRTTIRSRLRPMNPNPCQIAPRFAGSEASAPYRGVDGGRVDPSRTNDERALEFAHTEPERRFLKRRLANASARPPPLVRCPFRASVRGADDTTRSREQRIENGA
jgi:RNA polymerase sigma factor (sigma-70 family)